MSPKPDPRIAEPPASAGYAATVEREVDVYADPAVANSVSKSIKEFEEINEEAADLDIEPPSPNVQAVAYRILIALIREFPRYYAVSPGEGREVAIQTGAGTGKGHSILIVCDEQNVSCYVTKSGKSWQQHFPITDKKLPNDFIRNAIRDLG